MNTITAGTGNPRFGKAPAPNIHNTSLTAKNRLTGEEVSVQVFCIEKIEEAEQGAVLHYRGPFNQTFPEKTEKFSIPTVQTRGELNAALRNLGLTVVF